MNECRDYKFTIENISWERIFFCFDVITDYSGTPEFAFAGKDYNVTVMPARVDGNRYSFRINLSAINGRDFLDNGTWKIIAIIPEGFCYTRIEPKQAYELENLSRVFPYNKGQCAYCVNMVTRPLYEDDLTMFFKSNFMRVNPRWRKLELVKNATTFKGKMSRIRKVLIKKLLGFSYRVFRLFSSGKGNRVLFMTETKDYLWGNLKYIHDRMIERNLDKDFRISVSCRKAVGRNSSAASWFKTVKLLAKQDYVFIDDYAPIFSSVKLADDTKLIQVWHAGEGFKSVGYGRFGRLFSPHPTSSCHKQYDYAITGSERLVGVYEEVFGIEKSAFLPVGMPRLDGFLDENTIEEFKRDFYYRWPDFAGKKIILFAPTFRGNSQKEAYYDYDMLDLGRLYEFCGEEYVILIKMHPFVSSKIEIPEEYKKRIIDFSDYDNINDLYYVTDILITDYSSNFYEFAMMKRPVLFYTYDREHYELIRGVHKSIRDTAPGRVCDTFDELMDALENENYELDKLLEFAEENFGNYDGKACDKVIDTVLLNKQQ